MKNKKKHFILSLLILLISVTLLATGSSLLTKNLAETPLGNLITWFAFIALQLAIYWGHNKFAKSKTLLGKIIKSLIITLIIISVLWIVIAYGLSGNMSFNFKPSNTFQGSIEASKLFWNINYTLVIAPIVLSSIYNVLRLFEIRKERLNR